MKKAFTILLALLMVVSAVFTGKITGFAAEATESQETKTVPAPQIGDKLDDFTVNLVDGSQIKYSEILKEHKAVFINCFASWCHHCIEEFPALEEAYKKVSDDVAVIAISTYPPDKLEDLETIKKENNLTFYMGVEPTGMFNDMTTSGFPASLLVDRFGVVCWKESGAIKESDKFDRLFQGFIGDDYTQSKTNYEIPGAKPEVEPLSEDELTEAFNAQGSQIKVSNSEDEYAWPFIKADDGSLVPSNTKVQETYSVLQFTVDSKKGDVLSMEASASCFPLNKLEISVDGQPVKDFTGQKDWQTLAFDFAKEGEHQVTVTFYNNAMAGEEETVSLRNLALLSGEDGEKALSQVKTYPQSLDGDEIKVEFVGDPKVAEIKGADGNVITTFSLLDDPNVKAHLSVGKEVEPDKVIVLGSDGEKMDLTSLTDLETDETGFIFSYDMTAAKDFYGVVGTQYNDEQKLNCVVLSETGLDNVCENLKATYQTDFTWAYKDGSERGTEKADNSNVTEPKSVNQGTAESAENKYELTFTDQDGNPVENVMVTVCADNCMMMKSDADGKIVIENAEGSYDVHVLVLPDGYENNGESAVTLDKDNKAFTFVLNKTE